VNTVKYAISSAVKYAIAKSHKTLNTLKYAIAKSHKTMNTLKYAMAKSIKNIHWPNGKTSVPLEHYVNFSDKFC